MKTLNSWIRNILFELSIKKSKQTDMHQDHLVDLIGLNMRKVLLN